MNSDTFWFWSDDGKKDLAIVKHYMLRHLDKKKWGNLVKNRKSWNPHGVNACFFKTVVDLHHHFIRRGLDGDEDLLNSNSKIRLRIHHLAIRDWWEDTVNDIQTELDKALDDDNKILIDDHHEQINELQKIYKQKINDLENENQKLKNQLQYQIEKRQHDDQKAAQKEAFLNKQIGLLASTSE
jgi:hypothetical protein